MKTGERLSFDVNAMPTSGNKILVIRYKDGVDEIQAIATEEEGARLARVAYKLDTAHRIETIFSADRTDK